MQGRKLITAWRLVSVKKTAAVLLCIFLSMELLSGCGTSVNVSERLVDVGKKGTVTYYDVYNFDKDYYDENELKTSLEEMCDSYNEENGSGSVRIESFTVEDEKAKLSLRCKTPEDFSKVTGMNLYQGKVVNALAEGYRFDVDFQKVENGAKTGSATKQDIYGEGDLKVVIIKADVNVKVAGDICFVSDENVEVTGTDSVSIRETDSTEDAKEPMTEQETYIVYK